MTPYHVVLRCSACDRPLADVDVHTPDRPFAWRVRAQCPYGCRRAGGGPEYSFVATVTGLYALGGYGVADPADPEESTVVTRLKHVREDVDGDGRPVITAEVGV